MKLWKCIFLEESIANNIFSNVSIVEVINTYSALFGNTFSKIFAKQICDGRFDVRCSECHRRICDSCKYVCFGCNRHKNTIKYCSLCFEMYHNIT